MVDRALENLTDQAKDELAGVPVFVDGNIVGRARISGSGQITIDAQVDPHIAAELTRQFMANFRDGFTLIATFATPIPATEKVELMDVVSRYPGMTIENSEYGKIESLLPGKTTSETPDYQQRAKDIVMSYILSRLEITDARQAFDVYVVTFTKTLQNWKAMVSSTLPDGMYYEVTYNGDKGETYVDAYKKFDNVCIKD